MPGFHVAFAASSREAVVRFYDAALAAGGRDNGSPDPRPAYGPEFFAAFVMDLDGYRLEAVCKVDQEQEELR
jgi:catechol 2,3-dioxygenase-like lactoylglutathione lyase family enzyme